jgi:hypothetical protein
VKHSELDLRCHSSPGREKGGVNESPLENE